MLIQLKQRAMEYFYHPAVWACLELVGWRAVPAPDLASPPAQPGQGGKSVHKSLKKAELMGHFLVPAALVVAR